MFAGVGLKVGEAVGLLVGANVGALVHAVSNWRSVWLPAPTEHAKASVRVASLRIEFIFFSC